MSHQLLRTDDAVQSPLLLSAPLNAASRNSEQPVNLTLADNEDSPNPVVDEKWSQLSTECRLSAEVELVIEQCMTEVAKRKEDLRSALKQLVVCAHASDT